MKTTRLILIIPFLGLLPACTTVDGPNGPQQGLSPLGAAVLQTATAAGVGAGTGALMRGVNPVAVGAVSAGAGSVASQTINAFVPQATGPNQYRQAPQYYAQPQQTVYRRLPNGTFVPVN